MMEEQDGDFTELASSIRIESSDGNYADQTLQPDVSAIVRDIINIVVLGESSNSKAINRVESDEFACVQDPSAGPFRVNPLRPRTWPLTYRDKLPDSFDDGLTNFIHGPIAISRFSSSESIAGVEIEEETSEIGLNDVSHIPLQLTNVEEQEEVNKDDRIRIITSKTELPTFDRFKLFRAYSLPFVGSLNDPLSSNEHLTQEDEIMSENMGLASEARESNSFPCFNVPALPNFTSTLSNYLALMIQADEENQIARNQQEEDNNDANFANLGEFAFHDEHEAMINDMANMIVANILMEQDEVDFFVAGDEDSVDGIMFALQNAGGQNEAVDNEQIGNGEAVPSPMVNLAPTIRDSMEQLAAGSNEAIAGNSERDELDRISPSDGFHPIIRALRRRNLPLRYQMRLAEIRNFYRLPISTLTPLPDLPERFNQISTMQIEENHTGEIVLEDNRNQNQTLDVELSLSTASNEEKIGEHVIEVTGVHSEVQDDKNSIEESPTISEASLLFSLFTSLSTSDSNPVTNTENASLQISVNEDQSNTQINLDANAPGVQLHPQMDIEASPPESPPPPSQTFLLFPSASSSSSSSDSSDSDPDTQQQHQSQMSIHKVESETQIIDEFDSSASICPEESTFQLTSAQSITTIRNHVFYNISVIPLRVSTNFLHRSNQRTQQQSAGVGVSNGQSIPQSQQQQDVLGTTNTDPNEESSVEVSGISASHTSSNNARVHFTSNSTNTNEITAEDNPISTSETEEEGVNQPRLPFVERTESSSSIEENEVGDPDSNNVSSSSSSSTSILSSDSFLLASRSELGETAWNPRRPNVIPYYRPIYGQCFNTPLNIARQRPRAYDGHPFVISSFGILQRRKAELSLPTWCPTYAERLEQILSNYLDINETTNNGGATFNQDLVGQNKSDEMFNRRPVRPIITSKLDLLNLDSTSDQMKTELDANNENSNDDQQSYSSQSESVCEVDAGYDDTVTLISTNDYEEESAKPGPNEIKNKIKKNRFCSSFRKILLCQSKLV